MRHSEQDGRYRSGFTLIETLVVVAIVGILTAVLLSAVMSAREAGRRVNCLNNLKQIGLGLNQFESASGHLPPAMPGILTPQGRYQEKNGHSPHVSILPYIEQPATFNSINFLLYDGLGTRSENNTARSNRIETFLCPSESSALLSEPGGPTSYRACIGPSPYYWDIKDTIGQFPGGGGGAFTFLHDIRSSDFTDGLSNTVLMSEKLMGSRRKDRYVPIRDYWCLGWPTLNFPSSESLIPLCSQLPPGIPPFASHGGRTWYFPSFAYTWYNHVVPPNSNTPGCMVNDGGSNPEDAGIDGGIFGASSAHSGVNCLMGDGGVKLIKRSISPRTWTSLSTRSGGEIIGNLDP